jgi:hypothetical protein
MTQQPYGYPPQQYPPQAPAPQAYPPAQPAYQQPPAAPYGAPQYPPASYPAAPAYGAPPQPAAPPAVAGTLDDYYDQPSTGGGPSISWKNKPDGTTYIGAVAGKPSVFQDTDPKTNMPKTYRDGRPQFAMKIPLHVQPSAEHPDGEASLYVRGQMRDEMVRAMAEVGLPDRYEPQTGDVIQVTLLQRKPTQSGIPKNVFGIRYTPGPGAGTGAPSPAPVPAAQPEQYPVVSTATGQPVVHQQPLPPAPAQQYPPQQQAPAGAPAQQYAPQAPQQPAAPGGGLQPPAQLSPDQQQLLLQLQGQQQG